MLAPKPKPKKPKTKEKLIVERDPRPTDLYEDPANAEEDEDEEETLPLIKKVDVSSMRSEIHKLMKMSTYEPEARYWLETGSPELNATLGSKKLGIPYGKVQELAGEEHGGKTTVTTVLGGLAQRDGAACGYIDLEDSRDDQWASRLGLDLSNTYQIWPRLVKKGKKEEDARFQSAEEMFDEAEKAMKKLAARGFKKQFWMIDSIANIQTEMQIEAGATGQNMRTKVDRAVFLSDTLPRWAMLAANYNAMVFLINQLREKVGMNFGDPLYSPGGRAIKHGAAIRARVRRLKNGKLRNNKKTVGIMGVIRNFKNKAGHGSVQDEECAFRIRWDSNPAKISWLSKTEAEAYMKGEAE